VRGPRVKWRIAFVHLDSFFPPAHGGAHMLRALAEGLAGLGHAVQVILPFADDAELSPTAQTTGKLRRSGIEPRISRSATVRFEQNGVRYSGVYQASDRFLPFVTTELRSPGADAVILTDGGGPAAHTVLGVVRQYFDGLLVYYPMTVHMLPDGPLALSIDAAASDLVKRCRVVVPSAFCVQYFAENFGIAATQCIPAMFDVPAGPPPDFAARFGKPAAHFQPVRLERLADPAGLADARPDLPFLARCAWRTNDDDMAALRARGNILVHRQEAGATATMYDQTSVTLVPSLCCETLGLVSIESMLRGIPVLSSDYGGLKEAAMGLPFSLPVNPIVFRRDPSDPRAQEEVPPQPLGPWLAALDRVMSDRNFYVDLSERAWRRASEFARSVSWERTAAAFFG
jgi:hypothetical protein